MGFIGSLLDCLMYKIEGQFLIKAELCKCKDSIALGCIDFGITARSRHCLDRIDFALEVNDDALGCLFADALNCTESLGIAIYNCATEILYTEAVKDGDCQLRTYT